MKIRNLIAASAGTIALIGGILAAASAAENSAGIAAENASSAVSPQIFEMP
jgi:hypothetical protein